jgi:hypothetical protein
MRSSPICGPGEDAEQLNVFQQFAGPLAHGIRHRLSRHAHGHHKG